MGGMPVHQLNVATPPRGAPDTHPGTYSPYDRQDQDDKNQSDHYKRDGDPSTRLRSEHLWHCRAPNEEDPEGFPESSIHCLRVSGRAEASHPVHLGAAPADLPAAEWAWCRRPSRSLTSPPPRALQGSRPGTMPLSRRFIPDRHGPSIPSPQPTSARPQTRVIRLELKACWPSGATSFQSAHAAQVTQG